MTKDAGEVYALGFQYGMMKAAEDAGVQYGPKQSLGNKAMGYGRAAWDTAKGVGARGWEGAKNLSSNPYARGAAGALAVGGAAYGAKKLYDRMKAKKQEQSGSRG